MDERNILIVDDEAAIAEMLGDILRRRGCGRRIFSASTTQAALECIGAVERIDTALLDITLERDGFDGFDLFAVIRSRHPGCLVYFVTGWPAQAEKARTVGAAGVILKPFDPAEVVGLLQQ